MIILASQSKLRRLIIESSGLPFGIVTREVDERAIEDAHPNHSAEEIVQILSLAKAQAVANKRTDDMVIGADTFAILPSGERIHKANSIEESIQLALRQSGQTIIVNTGVSMIYQGKIITDLTTTRIKYFDFDEETIRHLFAINQNTKRRHGGLGFFTDAPGFTLVEKVEGSYLGAMGLPMEVVRNNLNDLGYKL